LSKTPLKKRYESREMERRLKNNASANARIASIRSNRHRNYIRHKKKESKSESRAVGKSRPGIPAFES